MREQAATTILGRGKDHDRSFNLRNDNGVIVVCPKQRGNFVTDLLFKITPVPMTDQLGAKSYITRTKTNVDEFQHESRVPFRADNFTRGQTIQRNERQILGVSYLRYHQ